MLRWKLAGAAAEWRMLPFCVGGASEFSRRSEIRGGFERRRRVARFEVVHRSAGGIVVPVDGSEDRNGVGLSPSISFGWDRSQKSIDFADAVAHPRSSHLVLAAAATHIYSS